MKQILEYANVGDYWGASFHVHPIIDKTCMQYVEIKHLGIIIFVQLTCRVN